MLVSIGSDFLQEAIDRSYLVLAQNEQWLVGSLSLMTELYWLERSHKVLVDSKHLCIL